MMTLKDGPVKGSYAALRAPLLLRAVINAKGEKDVLNDVGDTPRSGERIHAYRRVSYDGVVNINRGRKGCVQSAICEYEWIPGVDGSTIWFQADWERWATEYHAKTPGLIPART